MPGAMLRAASPSAISSNPDLEAIIPCRGVVCTRKDLPRPTTVSRATLPTRYEVDHVCNLTDVDDKIIQRMARDGVTLKDLTNKYASLFFEDLAALNILPASRYPRATEHIDDIVEMIQARGSDAAG